MNGLRTDERQFLIYDDEVLGAVVRGLEAWALMIAGTRLREKHRGPERVRAMNAIGAFMQKIAEQRVVEMQRNGGAQEQVVEWIFLISKWVAGKSLWSPDIDRALDEIYGTITYNNSRVNSAGISGDGVHRIAVRGD